MKRALAIFVLVLALSGPAFAQSPAPEASSSSGRPWIRLVIFVPLAAGVGAGGVFLRRRIERRNG